MTESKSISIKIIDGTIFFFMILFVLSLSNSIFVNQIGYFGALIFVVIRYAITRENRFARTGLELAFVLYILADFLSFLFSDYQSQAFTNLLKRAVLIPIIYTVIAATADLRRGKLYFKLYIAGTLITVLIYLYFSYYYVINNLYGITQSGPSLFQYPITASEIISFTVIFLFAFLVNEKTNMRNRIFLLIAFLLSLLALISTYKRTGWMGAVFGLLIILVMKKQWKVLAAGIIAIVIVFMMQNEYSEVKVFNFQNGNQLTQLYSFPTKGRATNVSELDGYEIVSDYDNGLSIYNDSLLIKNKEIPGAVRSFSHWENDFYIAYLEDTRFLLLSRNNLDFNISGGLVSPGFTVSYKVANDYLYVLDSDSGLTIFTNPMKLKNRFRLPQFSGNNNFFVDSSIITFASTVSGFTIYSLEEYLPGRKLFENKKPNLEKYYYSSGKILAAYPDGIELFKYDSTGLTFVEKFSSINNVYGITEKDSSFFIVKKNGEIYNLYENDNGKFVAGKSANLNFVPTSVNYINNKLYVTNVKRSRLLSIFDPYLPSNFNRLALWRAGLKIFSDYPIFGVGDIDLAEYYKQYKRDFDKEIQGHMHNNFIHFLVTLGLVGFLVLIYLFVKIILMDLKIIRETKAIPFVHSYALGTFAAFCAFLVSGLTELNFWDQEITTLLWFTFGLNIVFYRLIIGKANK